MKILPVSIAALGFLCAPAAGVAEDASADVGDRHEITRYPTGVKRRERVYAGDGLIRDTRYFKTGAKEMETNYRDGQQHGLFTVWYGTGQMKTQAHFAEAKRHGAWLQWHANGAKSFEAHYTNGLAHGLYASWYSNGHKERETQFNMSTNVGPETTWDKNGVIIAAGTRRHGEPWDGTFEFFRNKVYTYKQGVPVETNLIENYTARCVEPPFSGHLLELRHDGSLLLDKRQTTLATLLRDMGKCWIPAETALVLMVEPDSPEDVLKEVKDSVAKYPCLLMIGEPEQNKSVQATK